MSNSNKVPLVPKLRFPEFRNAEGWAVKPFDDLFTIGNGRDYKHLEAGDVPVYGSGGYMLSVNDYLHDGESVCIGRKGTIDNPMFLTGRFWTVDTLFYTHSFKGCLPKFIFAIFQQVNWLKHNEAGGVPSLSKTNIQKIHTAVPQPPEQQKIADCLSSLDELIAAQARKVDALKTHKKGLMQQLFPREGETQPRLRFPEFAEPWIESKLEDLCGSVSSGRDQIDSDGLFDLYGSTSVIGKTKNASFNGERILVARVGANAGMLTKAKGSFGVTDNTLVVSPNHSIDIDFLFHYLGNININKLIFGSGQPLITGSILKNLPIQVPVDAEQRRVSACLSSLDELIIAQSSELEAFKTHKRGLMQQLFPASEKDKE
jgi:type I restriction enzyme S subunit